MTLIGCLESKIQRGCVENKFQRKGGKHESVNHFILEMFAAVWASPVRMIQIHKREGDV
jgi:hypothetical protein